MAGLGGSAQGLLAADGVVGFCFRLAVYSTRLITRVLFKTRILDFTLIFILEKKAIDENVFFAHLHRTECASSSSPPSATLQLQAPVVVVVVVPTSPS